MASRSVSATIKASPHKVWEILSALESWPEWTPTMLTVERLDSGPVGVGSQARLRQPKLRPAIWTVTEWKQGEGFTWTTTSPGLLTTAEHVLEPIAEGCRLTLRVHSQGIVGSVAGWFVCRTTKEYMGLEANGLKVRAEASSMPRPV
jgi:uncharacterized protein YndB with AHSA1/START domain